MININPSKEYMKPSNLLKIDDLVLNNEYIQYEDEYLAKSRMENNPNYKKNILARINDYNAPNSDPRKYKYIYYLGKYNKKYVNENNPRIWFIRPEVPNYSVVNTGNKTPMYQDLFDWEKDLESSRIVQENALANAVVQTLANSTLGPGASHLMGYLDGTNRFMNPLSTKEAKFTEGSFLNKRLGIPLVVPPAHYDTLNRLRQQRENKKRSNSLQVVDHSKKTTSTTNSNSVSNDILNKKLSLLTKEKPTPTPTINDLQNDFLNKINISSSSSKVHPNDDKTGGMPYSKKRKGGEKQETTRKQKNQEKLNVADRMRSNIPTHKIQSKDGFDFLVFQQHLIVRLFIDRQ